MNTWIILEIFQKFIDDMQMQITELWPKIIGALLVLTIWMIISYTLYKLVMYIFQRFRILELIDNLWHGFETQSKSIMSDEWENTENKKTTKQVKKETGQEKSNQVRYDKIVAKALSYYIFLMFFRWAIVLIGITEVEVFLKDLIAYLPSLFVGIMIGFFGVRFANSVYDIIYKAMELTKQQASKLIATGGKMIILFFTLMIMLNYIKIVDQFIINALFVGFITTLTIGVWLAFGLGGRDIARDILENFRK